MVSYRTFWLADCRGPFVGSGLQDPTGRAGTFLGNMSDGSITCAPQAGYFRHATFEVGYTRFSRAPILIECHEALGRPMSIMFILWRRCHSNSAVGPGRFSLSHSTIFPRRKNPLPSGPAGTRLTFAQGTRYEIAQGA